MENAKRLIPEIDKEYGRRFGLQYGGLIDKYQCEDAELIICTMGTMGCETKIAVDNLRREGLKVGAARIRVYRPFPVEEVRKLAEQASIIATIDRHISFGLEGFLASEIKASLYHMKDKPLLAGFIAGLGGRDVTFKTIEGIAKKSLKWMRAGRVEEETIWVDLRE